MDRIQNQDARKLFPGSLGRRAPQQSMTLAPQQQLPQHQVVFNMNPQQSLPCVSTQGMAIDPALNVYCNSSPKPIVAPTHIGTPVSSIPVTCPQQQPIMQSINSTPVQQQLPGTGPVNIDLGKL